MRVARPIDIQFVELASRNHRESRGYRHGLNKCINEAISEFSRSIPWHDLSQWHYHKTKGKTYCEGPEGFGVYDDRPLAPIILRYAVNDVVWMPALFVLYTKRGLHEDEAGQEAIDLVVKESQRMASESTVKYYRPKGDDRQYAPASFSSIRRY